MKNIILSNFLTKQIAPGGFFCTTQAKPKRAPSGSTIPTVLPPLDAAETFLFSSPLLISLFSAL
jgi:hypothetical protein